MGRRILHTWLVVTLLASQVPVEAQSRDVQTGIRQVEEGDFEAAILTLEKAVESLGGKGQPRERVRANVYLGTAYLYLYMRDTEAKACFRNALAADRDLALSSREFPPDVIDVFERTRREAGLPRSTAQAASLAAPAVSRGGSKQRLLLGIGGTAIAGGLAYTILWNETPEPGTIRITPERGGIVSVTSFTVTSAGAEDPEGDPLTFTWDFGDGTTGSGATFSKVYNTPGIFTIKVTVSDGKKSATATADGDVVVKSMAGRWAGSFGSTNFTLQFSQSGAALTGTYGDQFAPGTVTGNASSPRVVRFTARQVISAATFFTEFSGTADADVNTVTGSAIVTGGNIPFRMTRQ